MNTVTVWTRQVSQVLEEIERTGSYHVREEYIREKYDVISDHYIERYRWFTQMASKRIRIPEEYVFPIWLALSDAQKLPPAEGTVTFTLEVPEDQILVADMDRWGYCVNLMYVPLNPADERSHNEELKQMGIGNEALLFTSSKGNFYPMMKQKIIKSWERIFDPSDNIDNCVGTVWEIRPEWIREIERYD